MDGLIFDFDGVIVDSEPIHLACFRQVLATFGATLATEDYYSKYLGFDDHDCFAAAMRAAGLAADDRRIAGMTADKTRLVQRAYADSIRPQPGAVDLVRAAARERMPLAVCSGGLRDEIVLAARRVGVMECFPVLVTAEDVPRGKPDPAGYRLSLEKLSQNAGRRLNAAGTVVVEDAPAGIEAAKAAGMKVLAVASSYPPAALAKADRIVRSLTETDLAGLRAMT